ncbi:MAG TPA: GNAT family N-acetyltransferase [Candidatus Thermoplasmatota archaeon]|nr:GNAT family N-acetyltransferase [Candidatus Thermoplasmatota archaeon]
MEASTLRLPRTFRRAAEDVGGEFRAEASIEPRDLSRLLEDFQERLFKLSPTDVRPDLLRGFEDPRTTKVTWRASEGALQGAALATPEGAGADLTFLHIEPRHATLRATGRLLGELLAALPPSVARVRASDRVAHQWMHLAPGEARQVLLDKGFVAFDRVLLSRDLTRPIPPEGALPPGFALAHPDPSDAEALGAFAYRVYEGTTDFGIIAPDASPDAYLRLYRRFLGGELGEYSPSLSLVLRGPEGGTAGVVHTLVIGRDPYVGDLSVAPEHRGKGLGRLLLVRALCAYRDAGHKRTGLTVTAQNTAAYNLYRSLGFEVERSAAVYILSR